MGKAHPSEGGSRLPFVKKKKWSWTAPEGRKRREATFLSGEKKKMGFSRCRGPVGKSALFEERGFLKSHQGSIKKSVKMYFEKKRKKGNFCVTIGR